MNHFTHQNSIENFQPIKLAYGNRAPKKTDSSGKPANQDESAVTQGKGYLVMDLKIPISRQMSQKILRSQSSKDLSGALSEASTCLSGTEYGSFASAWSNGEVAMSGCSHLQQHHHALPARTISFENLFGTTISEAGESDEDDSSPRSRNDAKLNPNTITVILRNYPQRHNLRNFISQLAETGFIGGEAYDFINLPVNFSTQANSGDAFINFTSPYLAQKFYSEWNNSYIGRFYKSQKTKPAKRCRKMRVVESNRQGRDACIKHIVTQNKSVLSSNPIFHPVVYVDSVRVPFKTFALELLEKAQ